MKRRLVTILTLISILLCSAITVTALGGDSSEIMPCVSVENYVSIWTTDGTSIPAKINSALTAQDILDIHEQMLGYIDTVEVLDAQYSSGYNAHSYAWYSEASDNICWIDDYYVQRFIDDLHTIPVSESELQEGDIVTYWQGDVCVHSAIVDEIVYENGSPTIYCRSKWSYAGVYRHEIDNVRDAWVTDDKEFYRYIQGEHCLHMYEDNGDDGCIVKCNASKNGVVCSYTIECPEAPEYTSTSTGHHASCPSACFAFFEEHTDGETEYLNLYYHNVTCTFCYFTYSRPHTWVTYGTKYRCLDCGYISNQAPSIQQNIPSIDETTEVEIPIVEGEETVAALPPINDNKDYIE